MVFNKRIVTSRLLSLSLMQYSMLIPLMIFINPTALIAVNSAALFALLLIINHSLSISMPVFFVGVGLTLLMLFKILIGHVSSLAALYVFLFVFSTLLMFLFPYDSEELLSNSMKLSRITFFLLFWCPLMPSVKVGYMRFGYGMLPVVVFTYIHLAHYRKRELSSESGRMLVSKGKLLDLIILVVGTAELFVFGARGAMFSLLLFYAVDRIVYCKKQVVMNTVLIAAGVTLYRNLYSIIIAIDQVTRKLHISSYAIMKYKRQLLRGFAAASSSRNIIYAKAIEQIKRSPLLGNPLSVDESGGEYVHNLFLQVTQDLGVVSLLVLVIFLLYCLVQIGKEGNRKSERLILLALFSISNGRLMFSSTIWRRPEFWMLVCIAVQLKRRAKRRTI